TGSAPARATSGTPFAPCTSTTSRSTSGPGEPSLPGTAQPSSKSLLDKLGVKPGARVSIVGFRDEGFLAQVRSRTGEVSMGRAKRDSDLIFVFVARREELDARVAPLRDRLKPNGAIWVIRPKGTPDIKDV